MLTIDSILKFHMYCNNNETLLEWSIAKYEKWWHLKNPFKIEPYQNIEKYNRVKENGRRIFSILE